MVSFAGVLLSWAGWGSILSQILRFSLISYIKKLPEVPKHTHFSPFPQILLTKWNNLHNTLSLQLLKDKGASLVCQCVCARLSLPSHRYETVILPRNKYWIPRVCKTWFQNRLCPHDGYNLVGETWTQEWLGCKIKITQTQGRYIKWLGSL